MKRLALIVVLFIPTFAFATTIRRMSEYIDMASSSVLITHEVFAVKVGGSSMTQTIGKSVHSLGMLEPRIHVRIYNCSVDAMPSEIERDAYNPKPVPIDKFLIFETDYTLSQLNGAFPPT